MKHSWNGAALFGAAPFFCLNRPEKEEHHFFLKNKEKTLAMTPGAVL